MSIVTKETKEPPTQPATHLTTNVETTRTGSPARQPLSILGKITLWISVVRFMGGLAALIPFLMAGGLSSAEMSIYLITASSLAIVVLMATRLRWAPLVSVLPALIVFYVTFTQPFALFDLANPKGPNGGFITFVVGVLAFGFSILVVVSSIGAAIENYRPGSRSVMRRLPSVAVSLVAGMIIGAIFVGAFASPASTGTAYTNGVATVHMGAGGFLQSSVTISKGAKLLLVDDTSVVHDLFNGSWQNGTPVVAREAGAPLVNNLQMSNNSVTVGPFSVAGTYHIFCTMHRGMNLTIVVQ